MKICHPYRAFFISVFHPGVKTPGYKNVAPSGARFDIKLEFGALNKLSFLQSKVIRKNEVEIISLIPKSRFKI